MLRLNGFRVPRSQLMTYREKQGRGVAAGDFNDAITAEKILEPARMLTGQRCRQRTLADPWLAGNQSQLDPRVANGVKNQLFEMEPPDKARIVHITCHELCERRFHSITDQYPHLPVGG